MNFRAFMEHADTLGALHKYWLMWQINIQTGDAFITYYEDLGMHIVMAGQATFEEYHASLEFAREARGRALGGFSYFFEPSKGRAIFAFVNPDDAVVFQLRVPSL